jgi:hypothetical protein
MLIVADRQPFVSPGPRLATTDGTRSLEESPGYAPEMPRLFHVLTLDDGTMASDDEASNFLPRGQGDDTTEPDVATEP